MGILSIFLSFGIPENLKELRNSSKLFEFLSNEIKTIFRINSIFCEPAHLASILSAAFFISLYNLTKKEVRLVKINTTAFEEEDFMLLTDLTDEEVEQLIRECHPITLQNIEDEPQLVIYFEQYKSMLLDTNI